jgi:hypothetical protein
MKLNAYYYRLGNLAGLLFGSIGCIMSENEIFTTHQILACNFNLK